MPHDVLDELEKIDLIRKRTRLSMAEARDLLQAANGDVLEALVIFEEEKETMTNQLEVKGSEVLDKVKGLVKEGNVRRILVKSGDHTIMEIPVTVGVVGAVLAPKLAVLAAAACMFTKCTIEIERRHERNLTNDNATD